MSNATAALTLQLLEWLDDHPRQYAEVMEAWRSTCPRMTIWEDACEAGLIDYVPGSRVVSVSAKGRALLELSLRSDQGKGVA